LSQAAKLDQNLLLAELRRVEEDVVEGELQLAHQERLLVSLKRQNKEVAETQATLQFLKSKQQQLQQARQRILSLLYPNV
jgi:Tfp pilus assembly protein PilN